MTRRRPLGRRFGGIILLAVIALSLISLLSVGVLKIGLELRELQQSETHRLQADWLAESAIERAAARLALDPTYAGETWRLDDKVALPSVGEIQITVAPIAGQPDQRRLQVRAVYPIDDRVGTEEDRHGVQSSRELNLSLKSLRRSSRP